MAGLGTGSLLGGKFADRMSRRISVLAFGVCETAIGLFALISSWLYYDVAHLHLGFLIRYTFALPLVHFLLLLFPTLSMGASLPLLARGLVEESERAARTIGILYGVNTLGAALGAFAAVWFAIGAFGFEGTIRMAAVLNFAAAAGALWIFRGMSGSERIPVRPARDTRHWPCDRHSVTALFHRARASPPPA